MVNYILVIQHWSTNILVNYLFIILIYIN